MVKTWISWTLSVLLAFEPAAWAVNKEDSERVKGFLELTKLTQKEITVKEFYEKIQSKLPPEFKAELKELVKTNPNMKLPKIAVSKIKGAKGEEDIQLQFVHNGESAVMTIVGRDGVFAKVGKETFTFADMQNTEKALDKFQKAIPTSARLAGDRNPSSIPNQAPVFLKSKDILKLDKASQKKYFKNLRDLFETMEDVQNQNLPGKKNGSYKASEAELFASLFISEAFAQINQTGGEGTTCIVGGWVKSFKKDSTGKLSCGHRDPQISRNCASSTSVECNPVVYGSRPGKPLCVMAGYDTTQLCNRQVLSADWGDIPDLASNKEEFDRLTEQARAQVMELKSICEQSYSAGAATSDSFKRKFNDQVSTCATLEDRIAEINKWPCSNPEFKSNKNYQRLCEAAGGGTPPGPTPAPGEEVPPSEPTPTPSTVEDGQNTCDKTMHIWEGNKRNCHPTQAEMGSFCTENGKRISAISCSCEGEPQKIGDRCGAGASADTGGADGRPAPKKPSFWKKHGKTILYAAAGLVGLGVFYWAMKDATKKQYQQMLPPEPNDPAPAPEPAPTPPPPRPGVS